MVEGIKDIVRKWLIKADNDLKTAKLCFSSDELLTDSSCFHSQQAVEKFLKAYLISKDVSPQKTHKIEILLEKCKKFDSTFIELDGIEIMSEYAVELRYPDDFYSPSSEETEKSIVLAQKVKSFVISKLNEWNYCNNSLKN